MTRQAALSNAFSVGPSVMVAVSANKKKRSVAGSEMVDGKGNAAAPAGSGDPEEM